MQFRWNRWPHRNFLMRSSSSNSSRQMQHSLSSSPVGSAGLRYTDVVSAFEMSCFFVATAAFDGAAGRSRAKLIARRPSLGASAASLDVVRALDRARRDSCNRSTRTLAALVLLQP